MLVCVCCIFVDSGLNFCDSRVRGREHYREVYLGNLGTDVHWILSARQGLAWQNLKEFAGELNRLVWRGVDIQSKLQQSSPLLRQRGNTEAHGSGCPEESVTGFLKPHKGAAGPQPSRELDLHWWWVWAQTASFEALTAPVSSDITVLVTPR